MVPLPLFPLFFPTICANFLPGQSIIQKSITPTPIPSNPVASSTTPNSVTQNLSPPPKNHPPPSVGVEEFVQANISLQIPFSLPLQKYVGHSISKSISIPRLGKKMSMILMLIPMGGLISGLIPLESTSSARTRDV